MNRFAILRDLPSPPLKRVLSCPSCNYASIIPEQEYTNMHAHHACTVCNKSWAPFTLSKNAIDIEIFSKNYPGYLLNQDKSRACFSFWVDNKDPIFRDPKSLLGKEIHFHNKQHIPFYLLVQEINAETVLENPNQLRIVLEGAIR